MQASIVLVLEGAPERALRCLGSLAELPDEPSFEVVVVDHASVGLDELLEGLGGDVDIVSCEERVGLSAALALGVERCQGEHVVLLRGTPEVDAGWLAPLVAALGDASVVAATSVDAGDTAPSPVSTRALAARRTDLVTLPAAPDEFALAALVADLSARGAVVPVPESRIAESQAASRGALGLAPELTVVIPTLDATSGRVRRCVAAVQSTLDVPHDIVIVDNGAPPQGFTAPVNAGLRAARGEWMVVMNDDVEVLPGWWAPLRAALQQGAAVAFPHTQESEMRHDFAAWCFALSRAALESFSVADGEFFDPELRVWYQDTDLLHRLRLAGRPPVHVPASVIRHGLSETVRSKDPDLATWIREQTYGDRVTFEAKHGRDIAGMPHLVG